MTSKALLVADASIAHLRRGWEQEVSEVRADARQEQPKADPKQAVHCERGRGAGGLRAGALAQR
jgi:hypothetical protein